MDWTQCIDCFLRILQILTFLGVILRVSIQRGYSSNVKIEDVTRKNESDYYNKFRFIDNYKHTDQGIEKFLIYPVETDIKKLDFYSLKYKKQKLVGIKIGTNRNIESNTAILLETLLPEGVPSLKIKW
ncbi:hypothetical protein [Streptococcus sp. S784/96/1]|uniref:hypothetical protein n=1 Tax=Streptococcus sp. S784/96/1 TaxID=2653499 RepID=UPI001389564F|nr:hypothetical protein [Streptococcus sp. S784/96/1]